LADQLHASDEEPHRVRPPGMGEGPSSPNRESQAIQESRRTVDRPEYRALTTDHAGCRSKGHLTGWNSVLSSFDLLLAFFPWDWQRDKPGSHDAILPFDARRNHRLWPDRPEASPGAGRL